MRRRGFSLVELLVVIAIIGVLAAIAVPAAFTAYRSTQEAAITHQLRQIETSMESFKAKHGFYPTDFYRDGLIVRGTGVAPKINPSLSDSALLAALRQEYGFVLNKISPTHREFAPSPAFGGVAPIVHWYRTVGQHLNPTNALSFWLAGGLTESKAHPFTAHIPRPGESVADFQSRTSNINPLTYHDFGGGIELDPLEYMSATDESNVAAAFGEVPAFLRSPMQRSLPMPIIYFRKGGNAAIRQLRPYQFGSGGNIKEVVTASDSGTATQITQPVYVSNGGNLQFLGTKPFQIIAPGLNGEYSEGEFGGSASSPLGFSQKELRIAQKDNITSFSDGRIDSMDEAIEAGF